MSRTGSTDPHEKADRDDPRLAEHYRRKDEKQPSELLMQIAREEERIKATGESRTARCIVCGADVVLDSLAFAAGVIFSKRLLTMGEPPISPADVGFTCQGECYGKRRRELESRRQGVAAAVADARRHTEEFPDEP